MSTDSILPDNRTPFEKALEQTLAKHLKQLECPYPDLWNPQTTPRHLLPYLAHAKGVPDWGDDSEVAKRDTVQNIWPVQRQAGTRAAIKRAVDALGFDAEVKQGDAPYHLAIDLWREDVGTLEPDILARAHRRINYAKAERDVIGLRLNASASGEINTAMAVLTATIATSFSEVDADSNIDLDVGLSSAAALISQGHSVIEHLTTQVPLLSAMGTVSQLQLTSYPATLSLQTDHSLQLAVAAGYHLQQTITECY